MRKQTLKLLSIRFVCNITKYQMQISGSLRSFWDQHDVLRILVMLIVSTSTGKASVKVHYAYILVQICVKLLLSYYLNYKLYSILLLRKGKGRAVLKPKTVEEVSKILTYCNEQRLPIVPQGGNTSQVGAAVPVEDELIMSMSLMRRVLSFAPNSGVLVAEAGCVLGELQELAAREGLVVPLDLGAKGSCMIGGNVSTHAGGKRLIRYGNLHGSVLGLEAVCSLLY